MKRRLSLIHEFLLVIWVSTACSVPTPAPLEITKIGPRTITVTQAVKETDISSLGSTQAAGTPQPIDIDSKYFDGIIVITQYYTYLGNGLYDKAFDLFSSDVKSYRIKEEFVQQAAQAFKSVQILSIMPNFYAVKQQGGRVKPDPENIARFVVQIKAWGEGNMSGSVSNGALQLLFLELIKENEGWKINTFGTAPLP